MYPPQLALTNREGVRLYKDQKNCCSVDRNFPPLISGEVPTGGGVIITRKNQINEYY